MLACLLLASCIRILLTNDPDESGNLDCGPAREAIGKEGAAKSTEETARRHGSGNTSLTVTTRVVEVLLVGGCT